MWKHIKKLWASEPKRTVPVRSLEMQAIYEAELFRARMEADQFNEQERHRYERQIAEQQQYMKEQQEIIDQCKAEGMSDLETFRHVLACGYGPRVNTVMPPAQMIVNE